MHIIAPEDLRCALIVSAELRDNALFLNVRQHGKNKTIRIWDEALCCESRWITCDDDLSAAIGGYINKLTTRYVRKGDKEAFVEIQTTKGFITLCTHNIHNGYYGGLNLYIQEE